ncbi:nicotinate-nucleotide adenylyltransferase [Syntrophomonas palmitatica]|uniref:nicotinate-nucleotide adenylyltransferase n=1 Tax=Syntrophomonas palmitatica TaxID=402877 RepID=UPI0034E2FD7A
MQNIKSLGIFGGTFDPIHYGHLIAAECARQEFGLERVIFLPAARPPHKNENNILDAGHRLHMVHLAIVGNPAFNLSTLEIERQGPSYTIDSIEYFRSRFPRTEIYFIMGMDSLLIFGSWKEYQRLAGLCRFIVCTRPGYVMDKNNPSLADLPDVLWDNLRALQIPGLDISSSDIRQRVRHGAAIKYLLPSAVEEYIHREGLYR